MKSLLYTSNTTSQTVAPGGSIDLGYISRKYGNNITLNGNTIIFHSAGYYDLDLNAIFAATAGNVKVDIIQNGTSIASATETIATAATEVHSLAINTVVRVYCCMNSTISVVVDEDSTATPTLTSVTIRAVKL